MRGDGRFHTPVSTYFNDRLTMVPADLKFEKVLTIHPEQNHCYNNNSPVTPNLPPGCAETGFQSSNIDPQAVSSPHENPNGLPRKHLPEPARRGDPAAEGFRSGAQLERGECRYQWLSQRRSTTSSFTKSGKDERNRYMQPAFAQTGAGRF